MRLVRPSPWQGKRKSALGRMSQRHLRSNQLENRFALVDQLCLRLLEELNRVHSFPLVDARQVGGADECSPELRDPTWQYLELRSHRLGAQQLNARQQREPSVVGQDRVGRRVCGFCWLGWNLGAATQALLAAAVASVAYVFLTIPLQLLGALFRGVAWVVLVRRGWQPPLPLSFDSYMDALDRELDAAVAAQDQADALVASTMDRLGSIDGSEVRQVVHVDYPLHTTDPALASSTVAGSRGPGLRVVALAAVVVVALAIGIRSVDIPQPPEWSEIHEANQSNEVGP